MPTVVGTAMTDRREGTGAAGLWVGQHAQQQRQGSWRPGNRQGRGNRRADADLERRLVEARWPASVRVAIRVGGEEASGRGIQGDGSRSMTGSGSKQRRWNPLSRVRRAWACAPRKKSAIRRVRTAAAPPVLPALPGGEVGAEVDEGVEADAGSWQGTSHVAGVGEDAPTSAQTMGGSAHGRGRMRQREPARTPARGPDGGSGHPESTELSAAVITSRCLLRRPDRAATPGPASPPGRRRRRCDWGAGRRVSEAGRQAPGA